MFNMPIIPSDEHPILSAAEWGPEVSDAKTMTTEIMEQIYNYVLERLKKPRQSEEAPSRF